MDTVQSHTKKFLVERIAFFSDAVFAIAITLLIIEVKVPENISPLTDANLLGQLAYLVPQFAGFIVSFFVIGIYWINHHLLFAYVTDCSRKLLWANMFLLFSIVIMPFSSGFYSEYFSSDLKVPLSFYVLNISLTGFMNLRLWYIISNPKNHLSATLTDKHLIRYNITRSVIAPSVFILSFLAALINAVIAYWFPILIPIAFTILKARYRKQHPYLFKEILH